MHPAIRSIREVTEQEPPARWPLTFFIAARFGGRVSRMLKHAPRSYSRDDYCLEFPRQAFAASGCGQLVSSSSIVRSILCNGSGTCSANQPSRVFTRAYGPEISRVPETRVTEAAVRIILRPNSVTTLFNIVEFLSSTDFSYTQ